MKFIVILKFFLLILMAVRNIKQTIMKDYNIQSFCQPFLFCTTFILYSALSIIFFTNFWQKWLLVHWLQIIRPLIFRWTLYQADISIKQTLQSCTNGVHFTEIFSNWGLPHARLNSHYVAWSYEKKKHKKIRVDSKSVQKEPTVKR